VKRFDQESTESGYTRARMISVLTLPEAEETPDKHACWSYNLPAGTLRWISERPSVRRQPHHQRIDRPTATGVHQPCVHALAV